MKLGIMQSSKIKDHGNFYSNYGGQTQKNSFTNQNNAISRALPNKLKDDFSKAGFKLGSVVLIPDGTEVSDELASKRDAQLGGFSSDD